MSARTEKQQTNGDRGVVVVGHRTRDAGDRVPCRAPVTHDHAVLAFYVGGTATIEQRSRWTAREGAVQIVPAGEPHRVVGAERTEMWSVGFCVPCFAGEDRGSILAEPFDRVRRGQAAIVEIPTARQGFLVELFQELERETALTTRESGAIQQSLLTLIVGEVTRAARWSPDVERPDDVVADSLRVIEQRCLGPLTLTDVAAAVNRSPAHVTTALRRATGRSAVSWIIAGRLAEARRRLLHTDERIDVIAERVGYADVTHFIRLFRREHAETPAAWRVRQRTARPA
jgi:AraC-like DNA-binding protein